MSVKSGLRTRVRAARRALSDRDRETARAAICDAVLEHCRLRVAAGTLSTGARVAGYVPFASEPGSIELLVALGRSGYEVIVPITQPDGDLDWARWTPDREDRPPLGSSAVVSSALVLVPAFAVDPAGRRLGRGGGSYDRALARMPDGVEVAAVLFDGEVLPEVPVDAWDRPVTAVVTPTGWTSLR